MKTKNYHVYGDIEYLKGLRDDYQFLGRECAIINGELVVFALPQKRKKKADEDDSRGDSSRG